MDGKSGCSARCWSLRFEDGQVVQANVVVYAMGYQKDARVQAAGILGEDVAGELPYFRGLGEGMRFGGL